MTSSELNTTTTAAYMHIQEEQSRQQHIQDPGSRWAGLDSSNLDSLKKRHAFLNEYSDEVLATTPLETLLKLETTSIKLHNMEKGNNVDEKLAANRDNLENNNIKVNEGVDNMWSALHPARFLPGAGCSAVKMWLKAREVLDGSKIPAISIYDMASIGLAGYVTPKGWSVIHDPGNSNLQLKLFSINNCGQRTSSKSGEYGDEELQDVAEIGELKCALRVMREAMAFVSPWNKSVAAIEGFLIQNHFCSSDLDGLEKQAQILSQFIDYCLRENSNRWRGHEAFLTVAELKGTWSSFFGARPQALLAKAKKPYKQERFGFKQNDNYRGNDYRSNDFRSNDFRSNDGWQKMNPMLFFDDICVMWNLGKCVKPPGTCATKKGRLLKHICNFRPDPANPQTYCGALHPCFSFHK